MIAFLNNSEQAREQEVGATNIQSPPQKIMEGLRRMGLLAAAGAPQGCPLAGGVSSDIWRVNLPDGPICVKRALPKLRVAMDWQAPIARNMYEARWMRRAAATVPRAVPKLLGQDETSGTLAMEYLAPEDYPLWKAELRKGSADPIFARAVASVLVQIHATTSADPSVAAEFPTDQIFRQIRLEPYLLATAHAHADRADVLVRLAEETARVKCALVHGDVSPKNILIGAHGPIFLDAECAWWGDPAFDLAFCLNHLLLKCLWVPGARDSFLLCFQAMVDSYLTGVCWEEPSALERRGAHLLPALLLARVDGKSPVEYLGAESCKNQVRRVARALLARPVERFDSVCDVWVEELDR
jgi:fructosamine-3-kinase